MNAEELQLRALNAREKQQAEAQRQLDEWVDITDIIAEIEKQVLDAADKGEAYTRWYRKDVSDAEVEKIFQYLHGKGFSTCRIEGTPKNQDGIPCKLGIHISIIGNIHW